MTEIAITLTEEELEYLEFAMGWITKSIGYPDSTGRPRARATRAPKARIRELPRRPSSWLTRAPKGCPETRCRGIEASPEGRAVQIQVDCGPNTCGCQ